MVNYQSQDNTNLYKTLYKGAKQQTPLKKMNMFITRLKIKSEVVSTVIETIKIRIE